MSFSQTIFFQFDKKATISFPKESVQVNITNKKVIDNVYFTKANLLFKDDITALSKSKVDGIMLDFNLLGNISYQSKINNHKFETFKNRTDIELIKDEHTEAKVKTGEVNKISLIVKKDFLHANLPKNKKSDYVLNTLEKNSCHELLKSGNTSFFTNKFLNQLYNFDIYLDNLGDIYLQSKVLEILYFEFFELFKDEKVAKNSIVKFDEQDMQSLYKAKELIICLKEDFTISSLAKKVALNEFKLKYGFKKYFNISPGNLAIQQKMIKARELLQMGEYNINEVSIMLGYKYQQSFTSTFSKYYGFSPKKLIKTKKYYY